MKSFGTYISKHLASFAAFLLILVIVNVVLYGVTFYHTVSEDYGEASPRAMLELTSTAATTEGLPDYAEQKLRQYNIWAMYLTSTGECFWTARCATRSAANITSHSRGSFIFQRLSRRIILFLSGVQRMDC